MKPDLMMVGFTDHRGCDQSGPGGHPIDAVLCAACETRARRVWVHHRLPSDGETLGMCDWCGSDVILSRPETGRFVRREATR